MPGPNQKPTQLQINEGDPQKKGKRKLEQKLASEPKAQSGLPPCPKHLHGLARTAWNFWSEELAVMKLDKRPDAIALEGACRMYERAVGADIAIERDGFVIKDQFIDDSGEIHVLKTKKNPAVEVSHQAWTLVKAFCGQFGFDPASRTRLTIDASDRTDEEDFLKSLSEPRTPISERVQ